MSPEITLRLLRDGYDALDVIRAARGGSDWFAARMLGRKALVVRGEDGVRTFYDEELVVRRGAFPAPFRLLLFGPGAVHGLDGEEHRRRKRIFLDIVDEESALRLRDEVAARLAARVESWSGRDVHLFQELVEVYGGAALAWAGIDVSEEQAVEISHELARIVDGFGVRGTPYPRAALARIRLQRWARRLVLDARRAGSAPAATALGRIAASELTPTVAATELLNVVRPTVAVAYFGAFAGHALAESPSWKARLASGDPAELRAFEHELRRRYPFVPLVTGRLRRELVHDGTTFPPGSFIVLDVRGVNHDPGTYAEPQKLCPERFLGREPDAYDYVPHGGGHPAHGHRCPGEPLAVQLLSVTIGRLAALSFTLDGSAPKVPMRRLPSLPPDGLVLRDVDVARGL